MWDIEHGPERSITDLLETEMEIEIPISKSLVDLPTGFLSRSDSEGISILRQIFRPQYDGPVAFTRSTFSLLMPLTRKDRSFLMSHSWPVCFSLTSHTTTFRKHSWAGILSPIDDCIFFDISSRPIQGRNS